MNILLVEDDPLIGLNIQNALKFMGYIVLGPFVKGNQALAEIAKSDFDLAILDVELKDDISGFDVAREIKKSKSVPVIFITGLLTDATRNEAKSLNAFAFINKPFHERNLFNAIDLAINRFSENDNIQSVNENAKTKPIRIRDRFYVKKNEKFTRINIDDVLFLEASGHYIIVYLENDQLLVSNNLSAFLEELNHSDIIRVHRSFAINIKTIPDFDDAFVYYGQKPVPISRAYKDVIKLHLNTF
ncbi:MAG: LytR/AlgR family response regulator transcription factor [Bacteroidia bacterium]